MSFGRDEPIFAIGIVARRIGVHQQTLRNYERWGLVIPKRSGGGTRYYSMRDIEKVEKIREWIDVLGINRAGVEVMTRLLKRISDLEHEVRDLKLKLVKDRLGPEQLPEAAEGQLDESESGTFEDRRSVGREADRRSDGS